MREKWSRMMSKLPHVCPTPGAGRSMQLSPGLHVTLAHELISTHRASPSSYRVPGLHAHDRPSEVFPAGGRRSEQTAPEGREKWP